MPPAGLFVWGLQNTCVALPTYFCEVALPLLLLPPVPARLQNSRCISCVRSSVSRSCPLTCTGKTLADSLYSNLNALLTGFTIVPPEPAIGPRILLSLIH